ncbi:hypothetical protein ACFYN9_33055 [Streptomyces collinus]|uniref:DNA primase/polymerase bifunctional N-terminal domain-containing protein n=1 Tax=Streptomyces violaceochromogenes TaxID=67377 RepID=A0ABU6LZ21_9ACTN|nr:hypothetical protein [Streptomyces violaceochromogenes]MEC7054552.1 hypothetical protein [Streptomyces violaceochromogenes]
MATAHWLLSTLPTQSRDRARLEWQEHQVAMLPLGTLFSAVRIPGRLVADLTACTETAELDAFMGQALNGGPVICDPRHHRYYALVPAGMPKRWQRAADAWRAMDVELLGIGSYLGVPQVDAVECTPARASHWAVPMNSAATLCSRPAVARLIAAGRRSTDPGVEE